MASQDGKPENRFRRVWGLYEGYSLSCLPAFRVYGDLDAPDTVLLGEGEIIPGTDLMISHSHQYSMEKAWVLSQAHIEKWRLASKLPSLTSLKLWWSLEVAKRKANLGWNQAFQINSRRLDYLVDLLDAYQNSWTFWAVFSCAGAIYGGLHAVAWNATFLQPIELLLWRLSSLLIIGVGPLIVLIGCLHQFLDRYDYRLGKLVPRALALTLVSLNASLALACFMARAYLIVEAFISLPYSPPGVYAVPTWSAYFPHFG